MKAVTYQGPNQVQVKQVDDAKLEKKDDIIVKITSTAICGSDLHLYQATCPYLKDTLSAMNQWESLKKSGQMSLK